MHTNVYSFSMLLLYIHMSQIVPLVEKKKKQQIKQIIRGLSHEPHNLPVQAISVSISVDLNFIFHHVPQLNVSFYLDSVFFQFLHLRESADLIPFLPVKQREIKL